MKYNSNESNILIYSKQINVIIRWLNTLQSDFRLGMAVRYWNYRLYENVSDDFTKCQLFIKNKNEAWKCEKLIETFVSVVTVET